ncbi:MAG TPA: type II secretion system protein [Aquihabitans sp.]|jgi:prepilin-type N-terminal cleavage/methylation domain-containing protein|nr:type II secretion system protein [Aquihabitans sp.]
MLKHHLSPTRRRAEHGFTILEVIVSVAVLGVIIVPLSLSLATSFRVTASINDELSASANRDQAASRFSKDVASVDAAGASMSTTAVCKSASYDPSDVLFVNLNTTTVDSAGAPKTRRATYWITGTGTSVALVRSACEGVTAGAEKTGGTVTVVANGFGTKTSTPATAVQGLNGAGANPCDEYSCTIKFAGKTSFTVTAQRRVFGAGVPLQVAKQYSSSGTLYKQIDITTGNEGESELVWGGQLSLAPGLDGSTDLTVQFKVQQLTSGQYLRRVPGPTVDYDFNSTTDAFVDAHYDATTATWSVPLGLADLTYGGEYRVFTKLVPVSGPAKQYGGVNGFPLWVDWKPALSVFVSQGAAAGGTGLTSGSPKQTILDGLTVAKTADGPGRPNVLVATSATDYGTLNTTGLAATTIHTVMGGFNPTTWLRAGPTTSSGAGMTKVTGNTPTTTAGTGVLVSGGAKLQIRQLFVGSGPADTSATHKSAYGIRVVGGANVVLENSRVTAQNGGVGAAGTDGAIGTTGCLGRQGASANTSPNNNWDLPPEFVNGIYIGPRPAACTGAGDRAAGAGGAGGSKGNTGVKGGNGSGQKGGEGGNPGTGRSCTSTGTTDATDPGDGGGSGLSGTWTAANPLPGSSGVGGGTPSGTALTVGTTWVGGDGMDGQPGTYGSGGGGSGGGGGRGDCLFGTGSAGGQGATGGQGGAPGGKGTGGKAGGSSFAVYVHGSTFALSTTHPSALVAGNGGNGGKGGNGGRGGAGGVGGNGKTQSTGGSTAGAGGGAGGGGGGAGAGGQGGWSVALYSNGAAITTTASTLTAGARGDGGLRGTPGDVSRGGAGGLGTSDSILFGLITYSTSAGSNGGAGPAGSTVPSYYSGGAGGTEYMAGAAGKACTSSQSTGSSC